MDNTKLQDEREIDQGKYTNYPTCKDIIAEFKYIHKSHSQKANCFKDLKNAINDVISNWKNHFIRSESFLGKKELLYNEVIENSEFMKWCGKKPGWTMKQELRDLEEDNELEEELKERNAENYSIVYGDPVYFKSRISHL